MNRTKIVNIIGVLLFVGTALITTTSNKKRQDTLIDTVKEEVKDSVIKDLTKDTVKVQVVTKDFDYVINTDVYDTIVINKPCIILVKKR